MHAVNCFCFKTDGWWLLFTIYLIWTTPSLISQPPIYPRVGRFWPKNYFEWVPLEYIHFYVKAKNISEVTIRYLSSRYLIRAEKICFLNPALPHIKRSRIVRRFQKYSDKMHLSQVFSSFNWKNAKNRKFPCFFFLKLLKGAFCRYGKLKFCVFWCMTRLGSEKKFQPLSGTFSKGLSSSQ
jgi:hypothetical protein